MDADTSASDSFLPKTNWERVRLAATGDRAAIGDLYGKYQSPLRAFLFYKFSLSEVQAKEFVHDFLIDKLAPCSAKANPQVGKFRNLLLTAVANYANDRISRDNAARRKPKGGFVSIDDPDAPNIPLPTNEAETELEWTRTVIAEALRRVQEFYAGKGKEKFANNFSAARSFSLRA
jgi:DNA-directed RNA polymerase specialized sigma24 family protein